MKYLHRLARNIKSLRAVHALTQEDLSLNTEISLSVLRELEHGRGNPTLSTLERLADGLDVDLSILLAENCKLHIMDIYLPLFKQLNGFQTLSPEEQAAAIKCFSEFIQLVFKAQQHDPG